MNMYGKYVKRILDVTLSFITLVVLSPLFLIIMAAVKLDSPGSVFFRQKRVKRAGEYFDIIKFRTMRTDAPKDMPTHLLTDPQAYVTKIGRLLRRTSLDELPQLINILKGDMSVVGPRPALWNQYDLIEEREHYGVNVLRPGLTGWAQVNGRDELPIPVKAELDGVYVRRIGFIFDLKIILMTITKVAFADGVRS